MRLLSLISITTALTAAALAVACLPEAGPGKLAAEYATPEGNEVDLSCAGDPDYERDFATPIARIATAAAENPEDYPLPFVAYVTPGPRETKGTLAELIPSGPFTGKEGTCYTSRNSEDGAPFGGFFASEAELDKIGRLCGCDGSDHGKDVHYYSLEIRVDLYVSTTGAREGFRMEASQLRRAYDLDVDNVDEGLLASLGDERIIRQDTSTIEQNGQKSTEKGWQTLLVRWNNVVARLDLSPSQPADVLLDYAAELDRNIEAAAQQ